jgi:hypothetical protein
MRAREKTWRHSLDEFLIESADRGAQLLFFDRTPVDRDQPIEGFWVRITDINLSAAGSVYTGYANSHPARLFADMARQWQGWPGELNWESLEYEFALLCTRDRLGHVRNEIRLGSRMGSWDFSWEVQAAVMVEAGQLERLARRAAVFFGNPSHT